MTVWCVFFFDERGEKRLGSIHASQLDALRWVQGRSEPTVIAEWTVLAAQNRAA